MDISTLALTAFTLAKPFLEKTQEGVARKIGEDIWSGIKKLFKGNDKVNLEELAKTDEAALKTQIEEQLKAQPELATELQTLVNNAQIALSGTSTQNINNSGEVEKQINIQTNVGNIQM